MASSLMGSFSYGALLSFLVPKEGASLWIYIFGSLIIGFLFLALMTQIPARFRKPIIIGVTFVTGWFYFLEFMLPTRSETRTLRRETVAADNAIWRANASLNRALDISKQEGSQVGAADERVARALSNVQMSMPHMSRAIDATGVLVAHSDPKVAEAETARDRLGTEAEGLSRQDRWRIEVADRHLADAANKQDRFRQAQARLESAIEAARNAEAALGVGAARDLSAAASHLAAAEGGIREARSSTEENFLTGYRRPVFLTILVIGAFSLGLGVFGLATIHAKTLMRRRPGWVNSLAFFVAMIAMTTVGLAQRYLPRTESIGQVTADIYKTLFFGGLAALGATMFSLVAFYIVSAAYRAFRARSSESALMMLAAFLVMLSLVPIGIWITSGLPATGFFSAFRLENIGDWILKVPNTAAQRGMAFGIGVGMLAMAIRIWFSLERGSYFDKQV